MELSCQGTEARKLRYSRSSVGEIDLIFTNKQKGETRMLQNLNDDETTRKLLCHGCFMEHLLHVTLYKEFALGYRRCQWSIFFKKAVLGDLRNLTAHKLGKTEVFKGFQIFQDSPR